MRNKAVVAAAVAWSILAAVFVRAKIHNDSEIARDTKRAADALENLSGNPAHSWDRTGMQFLGRERSLIVAGGGLAPIDCYEQLEGKGRNRVVCVEEK